MVLSKPDRVGMWFYQAVTPLSNTSMFSSYLLYFRLHHANTLLEESIPTSIVVNEWADILRRIGVRRENGDGTLLTILTFDSYYLCSTGRAQLLEKKIPFVASVTKERFGRLVDKVKEKVERPGQFAGIFRPQTSSRPLCRCPTCT